MTFKKAILFLVIVLIVLGVFFRFANLDKKLYWGDETVTSLRISGFTIEELKDRVLDEEIRVEELQKYQYPNQEKGAINTVMGLAAEEPQHPPLYFLMARWWVQWFGDSVAVTRSFSAVVSLLTLPLIFWLCQELFRSAPTGWVAVMLMAVSPFHVLYAQEARSYSFWAVTILLSSAALLRAMRLGTRGSWGVYAVTLALGLYTFLLSGIVALGHGIYVVADKGFRWSKTLRDYLLASIAGILLFTPWVVAVVASLSEADETTSWTKTQVAIKSLVKTWLLNLSRLFIDFNYNFVSRNLLMYLVIGVLVVLVGYSLYYLHHTPKRTWLFIYLLIGMTALALVLPDLILGGIRSSVARYLIPCYLGIQLAIAYLLATKMTAVATRNWQRQIWRIATIVLLSGGVLSCAVSSQAEVWWNKYNAIHRPQVAQLVNQTESPLLITAWYAFVPFSHVLDPKVRLQPIESESSKLNGDFSDVFVHNSSATLQDILAQPNYQLEQVYEWEDQIEPVYRTETQLWQLMKSN